MQQDEEKTTFTIRVERRLRDAFEATARQYDRTASQLIREYMRDFVTQYGQKAPKAGKHR